MKSFCFTIDDNIRFLKELNDFGFDSIFMHPYAAMLKRLHKCFDAKIQLNLFYELAGFNLSMMSDKYRAEWEENSNWLKLSFHSRLENLKPYEFSGYDEVFGDCAAVNKEIVRFASEKALAKTTTLHYCLATRDGLNALADNGVKGLLGLFGDKANPESSYCIGFDDAKFIRDGGIYNDGSISYAGIDVILNCFSSDDNIARLQTLLGRDNIKIMIHEQFFYPDYINYQPDFESKLTKAISLLTQNGYKSVFFEDLI